MEEPFPPMPGNPRAKYINWYINIYIYICVIYIHTKSNICLNDCTYLLSAINSQVCTYIYIYLKVPRHALVLRWTSTCSLGLVQRSPRIGRLFSESPRQKRCDAHTDVCRHPGQWSHSLQLGNMVKIMSWKRVLKR